MTALCKSICIHLHEYLSSAGGPVLSVLMNLYDVNTDSFFFDCIVLLFNKLFNNKYDLYKSTRHQIFIPGCIKHDHTIIHTMKRTKFWFVFV